jgi:hypothetical protein
MTNLRLRNTRKGEKMALTLADATGALEAAVFPNAYQRLLGESDQGESPIRRGAFLVAQGRLAQEEATKSKLFIENVVVFGGQASHISALVVA